MKKIIFLALLIGLIVSSVAFAADMYVVKSVNGNVKREVSKDKWEAVTAGLSLSSATVLDTGINGNLVLKLGDKDITIRAKQKGSLESLIAASENKVSTVKMGGGIVSSNIASASRESSGTQTASTRASDKGDIEFSE